MRPLGTKHWALIVGHMILSTGDAPRETPKDSRGKNQTEWASGSPDVEQEDALQANYIDPFENEM